MQISCRTTSFGHLEYLPRRRDRCAGLDEQRWRPHSQPLLPVVTSAPFGGDLDPFRSVAVQPPTGGSAVEGIQEILPGNISEFVEYFFGGTEFDRERVQPRLPRTGGTATKVRRHILEHQRRNQVRT